MPSALGRDKDLPDIPVDIDTSGHVVEDEAPRLIPSSKASTAANTNKALPSINAEKMLSEEEMSQFHELWNGAGLNARAHRRRYHGHNLTPHWIPPPISIPEPGNIPHTLGLPSADRSTTSTTPPTTGTRKRWGFLTARPFPETQQVEKKSSGALGKLRAIAQDRLKKKLRYAKSAPNLGDQAASSRRGIRLQAAMPRPMEVAPKDMGSGQRKQPPPRPEAVLQQEDTDKNAIYFTIDSNWRASQGSVQFEAITSIPDSPTCLGRPDSPLLHRHHSLDQLSFTAQQVTEMRSAAIKCPGSEVLDPIDELHAYLEL